MLLCLLLIPNEMIVDRVVLVGLRCVQDRVASGLTHVGDGKSWYC